MLTLMLLQQSQQMKLCTLRIFFNMLWALYIISTFVTYISYVRLILNLLQYDNIGA
jgi:hypothetical protein